MTQWQVKHISIAIERPPATVYAFAVEPSNLPKWAAGPTGATVHNPVRVVPNAKGSEVVFTLFRLPDVTADKLEEDARPVEHDLQTLKQVLEAQP